MTHLVTIGSAAWLGPHLPNVPLPLRPVLPTGFLKNTGSKNVDGTVEKLLLHNLSLRIRSCNV